MFSESDVRDYKACLSRDSHDISGARHCLGGAGAGSRGADVVEFGKKEKIKRIHRDVNYLNL